MIQCYRLLLDNQEKLGRIAGGELDYLVLKTRQPSYRHDKHTWEETIARHLADSLAVNDNKQLVAFVMEQYAKSDVFLMAAAVAKMYEEDCVAWFEEQLQAGNKEKRYDAIIAALHYVIWDENKHEFIIAGGIHTSQYHSVNSEDKNRYLQRIVHLPDRDQIIDWLMRHQEDTTLVFWVDRDNEAECARFGAWYYNKFFEINKPAHNACGTMSNYLLCMNELRWKKCTELAEYFAMHGQTFEDACLVELFLRCCPAHGRRWMYLSG